MIKTKEAAWLAGIIEGEGNLDLNQRCGQKRKDGGTWAWNRPRIIVGNTDARMIMEISRIYDKIGCKFWYSLRNKTVDTHRDCLLIITIGTRNVAKVLEAILPFMISKREQAKILLDYCQWRNRCNANNQKGISMAIKTTGRELVPEYTEAIRVLKYDLPNILSLSRKANEVLCVPISSTTNMPDILKEKRMKIESELCREA
jgi:hypothetical protein